MHQPDTIKNIIDSNITIKVGPAVLQKYGRGPMRCQRIVKTQDTGTHVNCQLLAMTSFPNDIILAINFSIRLIFGYRQPYTKMTYLPYTGRPKLNNYISIFSLAFYERIIM